MEKRYRNKIIIIIIIIMIETVVWRELTRHMGRQWGVSWLDTYREGSERWAH